MNLEKEMLRFGYTRKWFDSGILSEEKLLGQIEAQRVEGDADYEHYRYAAFREWLKASTSADDHSVSCYIELALSDGNSIMAGSALADLMDAAWLTDSQFASVAEQITKFGGWTSKRISRAALGRELRRMPLTGTLFEKCISQNDPAVHELLFAHSDLTYARMEALSERGANKALRNRAREALQGKRWLGK